MHIACSAVAHAHAKKTPVLIRWILFCKKQPRYHGMSWYFPEWSISNSADKVDIVL